MNIITFIEDNIGDEHCVYVLKKKDGYILDLRKNRYKKAHLRVSYFFKR